MKYQSLVDFIETIQPQQHPELMSALTYLKRKEIDLYSDETLGHINTLIKALWEKYEQILSQEDKIHEFEFSLGDSQQEALERKEMALLIFAVKHKGIILSHETNKLIGASTSFLTLSPVFFSHMRKLGIDFNQKQREEHSSPTWEEAESESLKANDEARFSGEIVASFISYVEDITTNMVWLRLLYPRNNWDKTKESAIFAVLSSRTSTALQAPDFVLTLAQRISHVQSLFKNSEELTYDDLVFIKHEYVVDLGTNDSCMLDKNTHTVNFRDDYSIEKIDEKRFKFKRPIIAFENVRYCHGVIIFNHLNNTVTFLHVSPSASRGSYNSFEVKNNTYADFKKLNTPSLDVSYLSQQSPTAIEPYLSVLVLESRGKNWENSALEKIFGPDHAVKIKKLKIIEFDNRIFSFDNGFNAYFYTKGEDIRSMGMCEIVPRYNKGTCFSIDLDLFYSQANEHLYLTEQDGKFTQGEAHLKNPSVF